MIEQKSTYYESLAKELRLKVFDSVIKANKGHLGGTFSSIEILVALFFTGMMNYDRTNYTDPRRDRFLIGKGHACLALYHIWNKLGILSDGELATYGQDGGLGGQLHIGIPGAEHNSGSLGHVLGIAAGLALAARLDCVEPRYFVLLGDGECEEGSIWESASFIAKERLTSVVTIVDRNRLSVTTQINDDCSGALEDKFKASGLNSLNVDGHNIQEIVNALSFARSTNVPLAIIADTVKGKGISFMENGIKWHHSIPSKAEAILARRELTS